MTVREFYKLLDEIAPKRISDEYCAAYDGYDNSGVLVDVGKSVTGAVFSLDLSYGAIDKAKSVGANLIVTHHPAIYGKLSGARFDGDPTERKLIACIENGISVISMHLNLDMAQGGVDEALAKGVILSAAGINGGVAVDEKETEKTETAVAGTRSSTMWQVNGGGYGRVYSIEETTLSTLVENVNKTFETDRTLYYGDGERRLNRAASFCGAGGDYESVAFAKANGADVVISSDFKHHVITYAVEVGLCVICLTHYAAENYGFKKYFEKICQRTDVACVYHVDERFL